MRHSGNYVPGGRRGFDQPPNGSPKTKPRPKVEPAYRVVLLPSQFDSGWVCEVHAIPPGPTWLFSAWAETEGGALAEAQQFIERQEARRLNP